MDRADMPASGLERIVALRRDVAERTSETVRIMGEANEEPIKIISENKRKTNEIIAKMQDEAFSRIVQELASDGTEMGVVSRRLLSIIGHTFVTKEQLDLHSLLERRMLVLLHDAGLIERLRWSSENPVFVEPPEYRRSELGDRVAKELGLVKPRS